MNKNVILVHFKMHCVYYKTHQRVLQIGNHYTLNSKLLTYSENI